MTWPICTTCRQEFIPIAGLSGCPWCSGLIPERRPTHLQDEVRICPTCGGPRRRHSKQCWDCYTAQLRRSRNQNPINR